MKSLRKRFIQPVCSANSFHRRGIRQGDEVVLVRSAGRRALRLKHSEYAARHRIYTNALADRALIGEEILDDRLSQQTNGDVFVDVVVAKDRTALKIPFAYVEILWSHAAIRGVPVLRAVDHLHPAVNIGAHALQAGNFCKNRGRVVDLQAVGLARAETHSVGRAASCLNPDHVVAELLELLLNLR